VKLLENETCTSNVRRYVCVKMCIFGGMNGIFNSIKIHGMNNVKCRLFLLKITVNISVKVGSKNRASF
jgi:hypothetical protein